MSARKDPGKAPQHRDTLAWLMAALQVVGPVLLLLILSVLATYGVIHLLFLR